MNFFQRLDVILARVEDIIIVTFCYIAFVLGIMQVLLRYVFNTGFHWNEAVFVAVTVSAILIGGSRAIRDGLHARVEIIATLVSKKSLYLCNLIAMVSALLLSGLYLVCGVIYTHFVYELDIRDVDSGIPDAITYSIVPISMVLFVARYVLKIYEWRKDPGAYSRIPDIEEGTD